VQLVFDHQVFSFQQHGGVSRYFCEVAERLSGYDDCAVTVLAPVYVNAYLAKLPPSIVAGRHVAPIRYTARLRVLLNSVLARGWLATARPDVVHETYFSRFPVAPRRAACVVTVFDMIHERFPEYFSPNDSTPARKLAAVRRADRVICISESTRRDLLERVRVDPELVSVVHLAGAPVPAVRPTRPIVDGPYVLYVGPRGAYKNFEGLLRAVAGSPALRAGVRIVAFGGGPLGWQQLVLSAQVVPTYLNNDLDRDWGSLERFVPLDTSATPAELTVGTVTRSGWETEGPIRVG